MIRPRRLSPEEHERQAAAFLDLLERAPGPWEEIFNEWGGENGKDFVPADAERIRAVVRAELIARGEVMPGWEDFFSDAAAA